MAPTKHPLIELIANDETSRYIGMLERKMLVMTLENLKMRALLELLTGDMWDDNKFEAEDKEIFELAVSTLQHRLGLSAMDARKLAHERWQATNPVVDESTKTYMIGARVKPEPVVTLARPVGAGAPFDHKKHLQGLETARRHRRESAGGAETS